jgi:hypothetical protein
MQNTYLSKTIYYFVIVSKKIIPSIIINAQTTDTPVDLKLIIYSFYRFSKIINETIPMIINIIPKLHPKNGN